MTDWNRLKEDIRRRLAGACWSEGEKITPAQAHRALGEAVLAAIMPRWREEHRRQTEKQAFYFSAEFLVGRLVHNNLFCLGLTDQAEEILGEFGLSLADLEEAPDAALGNGGLGRLAACYLDSAAAMGVPLNGYGIRYRYGLFRQELKEGFQLEATDDWLRFGDPWSVRREEAAVVVAFAGEAVRAVPYDMPVIGYRGGVGTLRLWQSEAFEAFDFARYSEKGFPGAVAGANRAAEISSLLYPDDSTRAGKILRLKQQYFFCSASLQDILRNYQRRFGKDFSRLADFCAVQLNDTHPVVAIPELVRLLTSEHAHSLEESLELARRVFAYTNHTVMPEALETWNLALFRGLLPQVYQVVRRIDEALQADLRERGIPRRDWHRYRIVCAGQIHMARLASYLCHTINGVSEIHTEILRADVLEPWYRWDPRRFVNVTNGVTQRRWLALCNPGLAGLITDLLGSDGWLTDLTRIGRLRDFAGDTAVLERFAAVKEENKRTLCRFLEHRHGVVLDERMVFDVQIKRLHEYKRQLLNAFGILDLYYSLKDGELPDFVPTVFLFGGKAAPGYRRAKGIIKYIGEVARLVNGDPQTSARLQVHFLPDYNVSLAEKLVAAAQLSEQISTAGTEASGTGNMKLALNGAPTIGTYDGANIEIFREAGLEHNYLFGARAEEIDAVREEYSPKELCKRDSRLARAVDSLVDGTLSDNGSGLFRELYDALLEGASWHRPDHYFLLLDFQSYREARLRANADCADRLLMARRGLMNTAGCGYFSSDRAVREYAAEIWQVQNREKWS